MKRNYLFFKQLKVTIPGFLILTSLFVLSCQQREVVTIGNQPVAYRSSLEPLDKLSVKTPGISHEQSSSADYYLQWQIEHERLVSAIEQEHGELARLETHRRVLACLEKIAQQNSDEIAQQCYQYQKEYSILLQEADQRAIIRMLVQKYSQLRKEIEHTLMKP